MAWTSAGGELLFIEAVVFYDGSSNSLTSKGKGSMTITGNMGKVMEESCSISLSWIRSHIELLEKL